MRFYIQITLFFLGIAPGFSQVGIGIEYPEPSAALEVFATDKGILIPRVHLLSTTDQTTITGGMINGLLVFNTAVQNDLQVGFYYWYVDSWKRLGSVEDSFVETITELLDNLDGTYTYTNELGSVTIIDIPNVILEDLLSQGLIYQQISRLFDRTETLTSLRWSADGTGLEYTDEVGDIHFIDLLQWFAEHALSFHIADGTHTTTTQTTTANQTTYQVHVAVATGATDLSPSSYGVVKELSANPEIRLTNQGELLLNYENIHKITSVSADYVITTNDAVILGTPIQSDITIQLPDPTTHKGKQYTIKKESDEDEYFVYVFGNIAGVPSQELYTAIPHSGWRFVSDGTQWRIDSKF